MKKTFQIVRCVVCRVMAVENVPADLSPYYSAGYFTGDVELEGYMDYDFEKNITKKTYLKYLKLLEARLSAGERTLFEVGCATGFFMALAKSRGWRAKGIDLSAYAAAEARAKGLDVSESTLENYRTDQKFSAVVMQDVIEHVKDPAVTLERARDLLKPVGLLALTTPDAGSLWARIWGRRWHAFVPPQHLFYFSESNLSSLLARSGFRVVFSNHAGKWFTVPYILRLLYSWTGLKIFSTLATLTSRTPLKSLAFPINVRDTLFILAEKV